MDALLDLEMTLYFGSVSVGFFSISFSPFSYEKPLFISNLIVFNLEFSLSIYWELITNFEFKFKFDLNFGLAFNKNIPYDSFLLTLPYGFLHLMLPCGLISLADHPHHQLEINLITNIWSWTIGWLWIHHKIWCLQCHICMFWCYACVFCFDVFVHTTSSVLFYG